MKKVVILMFCGLALLSCVPQQPTQTKPELPIVCMVDSFVATHPNFMNNEITREQANADWEKAVLDSFKNPHFLDGVNMTMIRINKTEKNGYIAQFRSLNNLNRYKGIRDINFDVLSYVPDSTALELVEKGEYTIYGEIIGPIDFATMQKLYEAPTNRYTDKYSITKCEYEDKYDINLANIFMNIQKFEKQ